MTQRRADRSERERGPAHATRDEGRRAVSSNPAAIESRPLARTVPAVSADEDALPVTSRQLVR